MASTVQDEAVDLQHRTSMDRNCIHASKAISRSKDFTLETNSLMIDYTSFNIVLIHTVLLLCRIKINDIKEL